MWYLRESKKTTAGKTKGRFEDEGVKTADMLMNDKLLRTVDDDEVGC